MPGSGAYLVEFFGIRDAEKDGLCKSICIINEHMFAEREAAE